jgi:hypothetical protein
LSRSRRPVEPRNTGMRALSTMVANPSIERTAKGLRPSSAAHVER